MAQLDPRLVEVMEARAREAQATGDHFQQGPIQGFAKLARWLDQLPKELGGAYSLGEALESLPPPGATGPAAPAVAAGKGFGALLSAFPLAVGRVGVLPSRMALARAINKRGLRGPWFHGTGHAERILTGKPKVRPGEVPEWVYQAEGVGKPGFDPTRIGNQTGTRLGEPAGVSVTRDPAVARKFGDILRVGVDVPPSSVGEFVDPEFQRLFKESFLKARESFPGYHTEIVNLSSVPVSIPMVGENYLDEGLFNQRMSAYLRSQGVEAIRYNPKRWNEFELRVLNPENAVPLGTLPPHSYTAPNPTLTRYLEGAPSVNLRDTPGGGFEMGDPVEGGFARLRQYLLKQAPDYPARLHDLLGEIGG